MAKFHLDPPKSLQGGVHWNLGSKFVLAACFWWNLGYMKI